MLYRDSDIVSLLHKQDKKQNNLIMASRNSSKIRTEVLYKIVRTILDQSKSKKRNFVETVELQICLQNYDPAKYKRFSGSVRLKNIIRPRLKICIIGDEAHCDEAKTIGIPYMYLDELRKLNKNKKLVKKHHQKYDVFVASDTVIKQIPRILGPQLGRAGKFPTVLSHGENMADKINEIKCKIKFQMKKTLCMAAAVGHVNMSEDELSQNIFLAVNFLVSLLKKKWQSVRSLHVKSTMGSPQMLY